MNSSPAIRRALLLAPSVITITLLIGIPLAIIIWVSFLLRGENSGVDWHAALNASNYAKLFMEEDFDGTLIYNPGYALIFLRSVLQAAVTTIICVVLGLPVALWMSGLSKTAFSALQGARSCRCRGRRRAMCPRAPAGPSGP